MTNYGRSPANMYGPLSDNNYDSLSKETKIVDEWLAKDMGYMIFLGMWSRDYGMMLQCSSYRKNYWMIKY